MTPAPQPEGAGRGARHARSTPSPRPRPSASTGGTVPGTLAPTGTEGARLDLAGFTDEELRVLASVAALAPALSPSAPARERMRARVLAGAGARVNSTATTAPDTTDETQPGAEVVELAGRRRGGHGVRGRFLVASAAALCLVVALSGISLVLSRDALPGDALYSLKRAGETTQLELTFSDSDRGLRHLDYAARRVDELGALVDRGSGTALGTSSGRVALVALEQVDPATVSGLMDDLDSEAAAGSGLLTTAGVAGDPNALGSLSTWAQGQSARLAALRPQLPADARTRLDSSLGVLEQVRGRADALGTRLGCSPITDGTTDDLGPLPATVACAAPDGPAVTQPGVTDQVSTAPVPSAATTAGPSAPAAPQGGTGGGAGGGQGSGGTGTGSGSGGVATTVPVLPTTPAVPVPTGGATTPALPLPTLPSTISIPLPLLPPVTIGPILPGLPPITIGG